MNRIDYPIQIRNLIAFLLLQFPLLYKLILFDQAFGFFYIGFILLLPLGINRNISMIIGLIVGLSIDMFSNTPGIHASACIFIAFAKDYWYLASMGEYEDNINISWNELRIWGSIKYLLPLIIVHHLIIFTIENGGISNVLELLNKTLLSSLYSFLIVFFLSLLVAPREKR